MLEERLNAKAPVQLHGAGTTNPSKYIWKAMDLFEERAKVTRAHTHAHTLRYKYYREAERNWPVEMYMEFQQDINPKMRAVLVDWLVEVHLKFKMLQPTVGRRAEHFPDARRGGALILGHETLRPPRST